MRKLLVLILARFFRSVPLPERFPEQDLRNLTFVTLDNSIVLDGILLALARKEGLSRISDCSGEIASRSPSVLYRTNLHDEENLKRLSGSPNHLFVTVNTIHGIGPIRTTRNYTINIFDALSLILGKRFLVIVLGTPNTLPYSQSNPSLKISRALKVDFYKNLKLIRGTPFQSRKVQAQQILAGKDYLNDCQRLARDRRVSVKKIDRQCHRAFKELAAHPVTWVLIIVANLVNLIVENLFSKVKVEGLPNFTKAAREHFTVLVPMHRSHLDYIILGAVLYRARLNTPLVAAGTNLNFWPVGFFLRRVGAFFVKRTGGADPIHSLVLRRYITYILKRGHLIEFFIEGGRSRTGRMRTPKLGLLKTIIGAYQRGIRKDINFVPVSISYEQVIEDRVLSQENEGNRKTEENIVSLLKARSIFRKKYGEVIIKFGEPISLSSFERNLSSDRRGTLVTSMARTLTEEMRASTNPTLTSLVCTSLLMAPKYALTYEDLVVSLKNLTELISLGREVDPKIGAPTDTLSTVIHDKRVLTQQLLSSGMIQVNQLFDKEVFFIPEHRRITADFYKNSTMHLFIPFSFIAISQLVCGKIDFGIIEKLHSTFEHDYLLSPWNNFHDFSKRFVLEMHKQGKIEEVEPGHYKFSRYEIGYFIPALMLSPIQSNLWVLYHLAVRAASWSEPSTPKVPYDDFVKSLIHSHYSALNTELLTRTETFSKSSLESTVEAISQRGIISAAVSLNSTRTIRIIDLNGLDRTFLFKMHEAILDYLQETVKFNRLSMNRIEFSHA